MKALTTLERLDCGRFTRIARAISGHRGVQVVLSGHACCTDGDVIKIPANSDDLTGETAEVLHGLLDHEVAHVFEERESHRRNEPSPLHYMKKVATTPRERSLLNGFEDIRIEISQGARWPGVADNLRAKNAYAVRLHLRQEHPDPWMTLVAAIIFRARGMDLSWADAGTLALLDRIGDEVEESVRAEGVADCWALTQRVLAKVEELASPEEPEPESDDPAPAEQDKGGDADGVKDGEGGGGEEADQPGAEGGAPGEDEGDGKKNSEVGTGEGDDEGPGEDGTYSDEPGGKDGEGGRDASADDDGEESGGGSSEGGEAPEVGEASVRAAARRLDGCEPSREDLTEIARAQVDKEAHDDAVANQRWLPTPGAIADDRIVQPDEGWSPALRAEKERLYLAPRERVAPQVAAMRSRLSGVLRARAQRRLTGDHERGTLDAGSLYGLRLGERRVFSQPAPVEEVDTAVFVLVDMSASMRQRQPRSSLSTAEHAQLMTIALVEALCALGVPVEVFGFTHEPTGQSMVDREECDRDVYTRFMPARYFAFKEYGEPLRRCRARLTEIAGLYENVDGDAVLWAARRLAVRSEARKLLFVLSDGLPSGGAFSAEGQRRHLGDVVRRVAASGIEVCGIGAGTECVRDFYCEENGASCVVIPDVGELAREVFRVVKDAMLERRVA